LEKENRSIPKKIKHKAPTTMYVKLSYSMHFSQRN